MRPIPLNLMTVYADLLQSLETGDIEPASIATKTVKGRKYVYATTRNGATRSERYLGAADDPGIEAEVLRLRHAAARARQRRATVSLLKAARLPAPTQTLGRVLEVVAKARLFQQGLLVVGTAAYQAYAPILGYFLPTATLSTNDVDFSVVELATGEHGVDFGDLLKRADPTFEPVWGAEDKLPKTFRAANGFMVELVTRMGRGGDVPTPIKGLQAAAAPLSFQEYLAGDAIDSVALHGEGVLIRVPRPVRYAIHKLIVAQRRKVTEMAKKQKDLAQAEEIIEILLQTDIEALQTELDEARERGRAWRSAINQSLTQLQRDTRQGHPPAAKSASPSKAEPPG